MAKEKQEKQEKVVLTKEEQELKEKLEALWTICPKNGEGKENDQYIDGIASDEAGATRLIGSGEDPTRGTGVRIRFTQPKKSGNGQVSDPD